MTAPEHAGGDEAVLCWCSTAQDEAGEVETLRAAAVELAQVSADLIASFDRVEARGSLYDAATHRWVDLTRESLDRLRAALGQATGGER